MENNRQVEWMAKLACREVVEQSARHVDAGNADAFARLFAHDAVLVRPSGLAIEGREAIRQTYAQRPADRITRHLLSNVTVELSVDSNGESRATVASYVLLWSGSAGVPDSPAGRTAEARQLVGEFLDQLRQGEDGVWLIQRREAKFVLHRD